MSEQKKQEENQNGVHKKRFSYVKCKEDVE